MNVSTQWHDSDWTQNGTGGASFRVPVGGPSPYDVVVGRDLLDEVPSLLAGATKVAIIHQPTLRAAAQALYETLRAQGFVAHTLEVPDAEAGKTIKTARFCWDVLGRAGLGREDVVIGFGGGAVTDLAGFVAATWLRGVRVVHIPTSLLGMVDAAIGGKTGVNLAAGKNLVGAFHAPAGVIVDAATLVTLPTEELRAGLAEVVKCGFIADPKILSLIENNYDDLVMPESEVLIDLIQRSIQVKANVVSHDFREDGHREILNYGHTLGHAIEQQQNYSWRHGHAVSVGMVFAAELSHVACGLDLDVVERHREILSALELPLEYETRSRTELLDTMALDKKVRGGQLRFVALKDIATPVVLPDPGAEVLWAALTAVVRDMTPAEQSNASAPDLMPPFRPREVEE